MEKNKEQPGKKGERERNDKDNNATGWICKKG
jgi:hypothetical protein